MNIFILFFIVCFCAFIYSLVLTRNCAYLLQSKNKPKSEVVLLIIFIGLFIPLSLLWLYLSYWKCGGTGACNYTFYGLGLVVPMILTGIIVAHNVYIKSWSKRNLTPNKVPSLLLVVILVSVIVYSYSVYHTADKPMSTFNALMSNNYILQPKVEILPKITYEKTESDPINGDSTYLAIPEYITGKNGEKISHYKFNDPYSNTKEQREEIPALSGAFYLERGNIDYDNDGTLEILYEVRKHGLKPPYGGDYDFEPLYALISADKKIVLGVYHSSFGLPIEFYGIGDYLGDKKEGFIIGNTNTYEFSYVQFE